MSVPLLSPMPTALLLILSLLALQPMPASAAEQAQTASARKSRSALAIERHDWLAPDLAALATLEAREQITRLGELRRQYPEDPRLWRLIGALQAQLQRWPEARQAYAAAERQFPDEPDNAYNLAVCLEHLGQAGAAIPYYQQALQLSERRPFQFNAAAVRQRLDQLGDQR